MVTCQWERIALMTQSISQSFEHWLNFVLGTHPCGYNFIITCFIISELPILMFILYWVIQFGWGKRTIMINGGLRFNLSRQNMRFWKKLGVTGRTNFGGSVTKLWRDKLVANIAMSPIWFLPDCYPDKIILLKNYLRRFQTFYSSFLYLISILLYELLFLVFNEK